MYSTPSVGTSMYFWVPNAATDPHHRRTDMRPQRHAPTRDSVSRSSTPCRNKCVSRMATGVIRNRREGPDRRRPEGGRLRQQHHKAAFGSSVAYMSSVFGQQLEAHCSSGGLRLSKPNCETVARSNTY